MNDILIQNNTTRNEIVEYIMNLLINVNKKIILRYHKNLKSEDISTKTSNDDFVSIADKKSEEIISKQIKGFLGVNDILGEETAFLGKGYQDYINTRRINSDKQAELDAMKNEIETLKSMLNDLASKITS